VLDCSLQPVKPDKAKLISRMAKMGQSMLPQLTTSPDAGDADVSEMPSVNY
jgi:hypothetical protein